MAKQHIEEKQQDINELMQVRHDKMQAFIDKGIEPFGRSYDVTHHAQELFDQFETLGEDTAEEEVMEEVGLKVKNIRYYKSQPWSFSGTLLFGFFCDVDGDDTLTVDHEELSMAQWVERDKIPDQGNNISLTKEMMMLFRDGKEPR